MMGGDGVDTVDYSNRSAPVYVTPHSSTGVATMVVPAAGGNGGTGYQTGDIVTVSGGTSGLLATLQVTASGGVVTSAVVVNAGDGYAAATDIATTDVTTPGASGLTIDISTLGANDGVSGEGDDVQFDVEIVNGGSGNDVLNAHAIASTDVVLMGNGGNDQLTGGGGNDDLCGGAGNDTFYDNAGNDYLVGGAGNDTADYSTGTSVVACLGAADQAVLDAGSKTCSVQNGGTFSGHAEKDIVNVVTTATAKVCPRASLNIANAGTTAAGTPTTPGGAMAIDVENLTGHPSNPNTLLCGSVSCTVMGGSGDDTLAGGVSNDQIYGNGGNDTVSTNGGNDLVDLTHAQITGGDGGLVSATDTVNCANAAVTILTSSGDTLVQANQTVTTDAGMVTTNTCINANIP
jgi:Ca2+-binding RTX toxin-like protein